MIRAANVLEHFEIILDDEDLLDVTIFHILSCILVFIGGTAAVEAMSKKMKKGWIAFVS